MSFEQNSSLPKRFVPSTLPWIIGLGALLVYLATLNTWATLTSIGVISRGLNWVWQPALQQPLLFLAVYPFRFLPEHLIPLALNVFNAVLASLVVGLLARTVALLPHNSTADQRELVDDPQSLLTTRTAWVPPVLAAIALGLQISFWENATAITGEMIDTLMVAYVIRCLLEYRLDERETWLSRAAFLYALGMTNNWALIGLAPAFVVVVMWFKGVTAFNLNFIGRTLFWGVAGLLLYLLLPLLQSHATIAPVPFWPALRINLLSQKNTLLGAYHFLRDSNRYLVISATSILPLFIVALRWRSSSRDNSPLGIFAAKAVFHFLHALFLGICLLAVFSPPYSARQLVVGYPFLTHAYLGAIVIGYCSGYFMLICSAASKPRSRMHPFLKFASHTGSTLVLAMLVIIPACLVARNIDIIRFTNHRVVDDYAERTVRDLPAKSCAIFSDDAGRLALIRAYLMRQDRDKSYLFLDTQSAKWPDYHIFQKRSQPNVWPTTFTSITNHAELAPISLMVFASKVAEKEPIYYLMPSFGYYFETFSMSPQGVVYPLARYPTNTLLELPLGTNAVKANEQFWSDFDARIFPALKQALPTDEVPANPTLKDMLMDRLHLSAERNLSAEVIARFYSRASTYWAVQQQKLGDWEGAAASLTRALALYPNNLVAQVNQEYNNARRKGEAQAAGRGSTVEERFGRNQNWNQVMGECGPFDDTQFSFEQARTYLANSLHRQALQQFKRITELDPHNLTANLWLADLFTLGGKPAEALQIVQGIRNEPQSYGLNATNELDLARVEATAYFRAKDTNHAIATLQKALSSPVAGNAFRTTAAQLYLQYGLNADALPVLDSILAENPADIPALGNRGYAYLQLGRYEAARESLNRALELDPKNNIVRLNRAITLLRSKQYDAARQDYETLSKSFPNAYQIHFGLGEIAASSNDRSSAITHFEACLKAAPAGSPDYQQITNRLAQLRAEK
jgi:tetratricopeptide (TPR) repeat protein